MRRPPRPSASRWPGRCPPAGSSASSRRPGRPLAPATARSHRVGHQFVSGQHQTGGRRGERAVEGRSCGSSGTGAQVRAAGSQTGPRGRPARRSPRNATSRSPTVVGRPLHLDRGGRVTTDASSDASYESTPSTVIRYTVSPMTAGVTDGIGTGASAVRRHVPVTGSNAASSCAGGTAQSDVSRQGGPASPRGTALPCRSRRSRAFCRAGIGGGQARSSSPRRDLDEGVAHPPMCTKAPPARWSRGPARSAPTGSVAPLRQTPATESAGPLTAIVTCTFPQQAVSPRRGRPAPARRRPARPVGPPRRWTGRRRAPRVKVLGAEVLGQLQLCAPGPGRDLVPVPRPGAAQGVAGRVPR